MDEYTFTDYNGSPLTEDEVAAAVAFLEANGMGDYVSEQTAYLVMAEYVTAAHAYVTNAEANGIVVDGRPRAVYPLTGGDSNTDRTSTTFYGSGVWDPLDGARSWDGEGGFPANFPEAMEIATARVEELVRSNEVTLTLNANGTYLADPGLLPVNLRPVTPYMDAAGDPLTPEQNRAVSALLSEQVRTYPDNEGDSRQLTEAEIIAAVVLLSEEEKMPGMAAYLLEHPEELVRFTTAAHDYLATEAANGGRALYPTRDGELNDNNPNRDDLGGTPFWDLIVEARFQKSYLGGFPANFADVMDIAVEARDPFLAQNNRYNGVYSVPEADRPGTTQPDNEADARTSPDEVAPRNENPSQYTDTEGNVLTEEQAGAAQAYLRSMGITGYLLTDPAYIIAANNALLELPTGTAPLSYTDYNGEAIPQAQVDAARAFLELNGVTDENILSNPLYIRAADEYVRTAAANGGNGLFPTTNGEPNQNGPDSLSNSYVWDPLYESKLYANFAGGFPTNFPLVVALAEERRTALINSPEESRGWEGNVVPNDQLPPLMQAVPQPTLETLNTAFIGEHTTAEVSAIVTASVSGNGLTGTGVDQAALIAEGWTNSPTAPEPFNDLLLPPGFEVGGYYYGESADGVYDTPLLEGDLPEGAFLYNPTTGQRIVVFPGATVNNSAESNRDLNAGILLSTGSNFIYGQNEFASLPAWIESMNTAYPDGTGVLVTGHSLGGARATIASQAFTIPTTTISYAPSPVATEIAGLEIDTSNSYVFYSPSDSFGGLTNTISFSGNHPYNLGTVITVDTADEHAMTAYLNASLERIGSGIAVERAVAGIDSADLSTPESLVREALGSADEVANLTAYLRDNDLSVGDITEEQIVQHIAASALEDRALTENVDSLRTLRDSGLLNDATILAAANAGLLDNADQGVTAVTTFIAEVEAEGQSR